MSSPENFPQSLRVIGQALETLRIKAFSLKKYRDKYSVFDWEPSFLEGVAAAVWGKKDVEQMHLAQQSSDKVLVYTDADAERLEVHGRSKRRSIKSADAHTISSGLRAIGDYLDRKKAIAFVIAWSPESITVNYEIVPGSVQQRSFTLRHLHDLAVGMYKRRSNR